MSGKNRTRNDRRRARQESAKARKDALDRLSPEDRENLLAARSLAWKIGNH
jgi:hypothetical protein